MRFLLSLECSKAPTFGASPGGSEPFVPGGSTAVSCGIREEGHSRPCEATLADLAAAPGEQLRLMGLDAAQASRHPAPPWVWMPSEAPLESGSLIQLGVEQGDGVGVMIKKLDQFELHRTFSGLRWMDDPMGKVPGMHFLISTPAVTGSSEICKVCIWL